MAKRRIIQNHHIVYAHPDHPSQKEVKVATFKGEHFIIGKINLFTRKNLSAGFLKCLKVFIALNEDRAIDLGALSEAEIDEL